MGNRSGGGRALAAGERARLSVAVLVASTAICFGAPLSATGFVIAVIGLAASGWVLRSVCRPKRAWGLPAIDAVTATGVWAGWTLPFLVVNVGNFTVAAVMLWLLVSGLVGLMILWALFTKWRHALISVAIVGGLVASVALLSPLELTFRRWQVQLSESRLRAEAERGEAYQEYQGVSGWIWVGGIPDGGAGVAYDPTDRVADDDVAVEVWHAITGDPGHCALLYDHWYWCK
ncbi:MAG: hypothetical protein GY701_26895 [Sulfitobacter sp.]|nr:hypothetical protein [Sulfitobacter sp.]MCP4083348.1 hypothetical protein [Planctomycetaceae bacterium]